MVLDKEKEVQVKLANLSEYYSTLGFVTLSARCKEAAETVSKLIGIIESVDNIEEGKDDAVV